MLKQAVKRGVDPRGIDTLFMEDMEEMKILLHKTVPSIKIMNKFMQHKNN